MKTFLAIAMACLGAHGQTFEVASVKPATPLGPLGNRALRKGGPGTTDPGMYSCQNCPVSWIVSEAFHLQPYEFSPPDWMENTRFDVAANIPQGTTREVFQAMLQNLLAERFQLKVHREKKEMQVYGLEIGKGGVKFKEAVPKEPTQDGEPQGKIKRDGDGFPILAAGTTMAIMQGHARIRSENKAIGWFVEMLSGQLQAPVLDATGLRGNYDFVLSWAYSEKDSAGAADILEAYTPALLTAVETQLGLTLRLKKGQGEVLVVDHMEKVPREN
jgi:uncharacterized protein (TIGR03435 family)